MNELILKFTGKITENNFPSYKEDALKFVEEADFPIVTDEDFSLSVENITKCKEIESAIKEAKDKAFSGMAEINAIFEDLAQVLSIVSRFRLKREKDVEAKSTEKKEKMISDGYSKLSAFFDSSVEKTPLLSSIISVNDSPMRAAIKGKRKEENAIKAISEAVDSEIERINTAIALVTKNDGLVSSCEYPELFPDKKQIIGQPSSELELLIENRVNRHKLAEKERKESEEKAAREAEERKAAEQQAQPERQEEQKAQATYTTQTPAETVPEENNTQPGEPNEKFRLTIDLFCPVERARKFAQELEVRVSENNDVVKINIERA